MPTHTSRAQHAPVHSRCASYVASNSVAPFLLRHTSRSLFNVGLLLSKLPSMPSGAMKVSDNKIQLKFRTKDFEGEYFYYSGDLFFIYKSGHLMKLTCQKRENVGLGRSGGSDEWK
jgi:hypothetical protein